MGTDTQAKPPNRNVLLVNPNTNTRTTKLMTDLAAAVFGPHHVNVVGVTAAAGPSMIIEPEALAESAIHVRNAVHGYLNASDTEISAVIVAAIGDPDREILDMELPIPVVGIGQASILAASADGRPFGMATSTPLLAPSLSDLAATYGRSDWFTGVRLTPSDPLTLAADPEKQFEELAHAVEECTQLDGAESVIIAGGPLSETALRIALTSTAQIIQPVPSACQRVLELTNPAFKHAPA